MAKDAQWITMPDGRRERINTRRLIAKFSEDEVRQAIAVSTRTEKPLETVLAAKVKAGVDIRTTGELLEIGIARGSNIAKKREWMGEIVQIQMRQNMYELSLIHI